MRAIGSHIKPSAYNISCAWCLHNFEIDGMVYRKKLKMGRKDLYCSHACSCRYALFRQRGRQIWRAIQGQRTTRHRYKFVVDNAQLTCTYGHPRIIDERRCKACRKAYMSKKYLERKSAA